MATRMIREARERLAKAVETAHTEAVVLERYGQPAGVAEHRGPVAVDAIATGIHLAGLLGSTAVLMGGGVLWRAEGLTPAAAALLPRR